MGDPKGFLKIGRKPTPKRTGVVRGNGVSSLVLVARTLSANTRRSASDSLVSCRWKITSASA